MAQGLVVWVLQLWWSFGQQLVMALFQQVQCESAMDADGGWAPLLTLHAHSSAMRLA